MTPFPRALRPLAILLLAASPAPLADAAPRSLLGELPELWTAAPIVQQVRDSALVRTLSGDETWNATTPRHQILGTGGANRTITLAPIGPDGIAEGTRFTARVTAAGGSRIMIRRADGELLAFWGAGNSEPTQWVTLEATTSGWDTRVSSGRRAAAGDPLFAAFGTDFAMDGTTLRPRTARSQGFAVRFESDAPVIYVNCRGNNPRFRVLVDNRLVASVGIDDVSGGTLHVPVELGAGKRRQVEILADALEFQGVEIPDTRHAVLAWKGATPPVRMVWIGDSSSETGTGSYPWVAARLLGYEVWSRPWGHNAQHVSNGDRNAIPDAAIAEDIATANPDVLVVSGQFFDAQLPPDQYEEVVGRWFAAIGKAARPEAVKIALSAWMGNDPVDRMAERRAGVIRKQARAHGFQFVNWQEWVSGRASDVASGNAHEVLAPNLVHLSERGNLYIGSRFADQVRKLGVERKIEIAAATRQQAEQNSRNLASTP